MAFYGYNGDVGDCQWTPYSVVPYEHDLFPPHSSSTSSFYEFEEPQPINYYYNQFDSDAIQSAVHYSIYGHTETRLIQYEQQLTVPSSYVETNYITNYSTLEFNEPEFEEYDETPYGGGYDLAQTYGKPLPPSDHICYPRSNPHPGLKSAVPDGFSYGSISLPYGEISDTKPLQNANGIKSVDQENRLDNSTTELFDKVKEDVTIEKPIVDVDRIGVDEDLSFDNGKGLQSEGSESDGQVPKYPYGSGLEAMDICESIFGYWPCLEKRKQQNLSNGATVDDQNQRDPWKSAADYLFGSGFVYEEPRGMSHGHGYYFDGHHFDYSYD